MNSEKNKNAVCRFCIYFSEKNQKPDFGICLKRLPNNYFDTIPGFMSADEAREIDIDNAIIKNPDVHNCYFFRAQEGHAICEESIGYL